MPSNGKGKIVLILIILFAIIVSVFSYFYSYSDAFNFSLRLFALNGFFSLCIAAFMTSFLKDIRRVFNNPFINVHHYFAITGLILATLHPVSLFIRSFDPTIFLPNLSSFYLFWLLAGRQALLTIYIAALAAFLLIKIPKYRNYWRVLHALIYVALLFAIVHGNLIGTDFQNIFVSILYNGLFIGVIAVFAFKRIQQYKKSKKFEKQIKP